MSPLLASIRALQGRPNRSKCTLSLRVIAGRKTHDILCEDLLELVNDLATLKALGGKDLRKFSIWRDDHDGTVSVRELN